MDRRLKSWGNNRAGQLGDGTWADVRTAATAVLGLTGREVLRIAAGGAGAATGHGLALLTDRTVVAWGSNGSGQLGDGSLHGHNAPAPVLRLSDVTAIAAGGTHSLALLADRTVVAWGQNAHGQLGNGDTADSGVPVRVGGGLYPVVAIAAGLNHSLALCEDGRVWAWGHNGNGQLGDGSSSARNVPAPVGGLTGVTLIAAGANHSLALVGAPATATRTNGGSVVKAWGHNAAGQLGDHTTINRFTPVEVRDGWADGVARLAAGGNHSIAVGGGEFRLKAWGQNASGQIGDGTTAFRVTPVEVPGLSGVVSVAGGREHTVVLLDDRTVRSWGGNRSGQLGDGTTSDRSVPVAALTVPTGADRIAAPIGGDFSLAH
ncbi:RCC1 domain-containing protein [Kitasatospora sp. NPDC056327]|uniref:RCC1 domain-containing protein n=1 Tax=Kitasatospora sp. NPDC056327 TaxID=3345785 RepID=UPI0035E19D68